MLSQCNLLPELEAANGQSWVLILDAGRPDYFERHYERRPVLADGDYQRVHNGGCRSTPIWFNEHFDHAVDGHLFHGGQPIKGIDGVDYDEDRYWARVPSATLYDAVRYGDNWATTNPASVNRVVEQHLPSGEAIVSDRLRDLGYVPSGEERPAFDMNVVRYLQPHTPYRSLPELDDHRSGLARRVRDGQLDYGDVERAYVDNYEWALDHAAALVETLLDHGAPNIAVSSDHGECLGACGEWFHGSGDHDHLLTVPWLRIR